MFVIVIKPFKKHQVGDLIEVSRSRRVELLSRGYVAIDDDDHRKRVSFNRPIRTRPDLDRSTPERVRTTSSGPKEQR